MKNATHSIPIGRRTSERRKYVRTEDGRGERAVTVATVEGDVTLYIDLRRLESYAIRSLTTGRGECRLAGGAITWKATNRKETPAP